MVSFSTLTVTDGSSINGNSATTENDEGAVSSPVSPSPLSSWPLRATDARSLREISRCSSSEETPRLPACPLAARRRRLRD